MENFLMKTWLNCSYLSILNQKWIEQLYRDFLINPDSVDKSWHSILKTLFLTEDKFNQLCVKENNYSFPLKRNTLPLFYKVSNSKKSIKKIKILQIINNYRLFGHQYAHINPLGLWKKKKALDLDPLFLEFNETDLQKIFFIDSFAINKNKIKLGNLIKALNKIYCGSIGYEYMHISSVKEKLWIHQRIESIKKHYQFSTNEKKRFLKELTSAEVFEQYLGKKFPGEKRFSLEGSDVLIPMLKEMIRYTTSNYGTHEVVLGMAHRGRLNVLINVLGKKPRNLFEEFTGQYKNHFDIGDVKYHMGFSSNIETEGGLVHLVLGFNPSHLEIVNPVVMGSVRARLDRLKKTSTKNILPITIHGDAAITGQGIVQETLNMSKVRGYKVGGTVRIVINNQIGFTTSNLLDSRSTLYCTDIGKMLESPIFHVNADDLEAVIFVARLALDFRNTFKRDVFIDLVCYRRHGHNEIEEPSVTQPIMYKKIKKHSTSRKIYANKLELEKVITLEEATEMIDLYYHTLDKGECVVEEWSPMNMSSFTWSPYLNHEWDETYQNKVDVKHLQKLAKNISTVPKSIKMQSLVEKIYSDFRSMASGKKLFDWSGAENLAYATLVDEGISVRLSGEDSSRGTFFHRHAIIHDQNNGLTYIPLQHVHNRQGQFKIWDSVLSEEAVLAFEYGYATTEPHTLTIWEAQFGDFANGAQIVIDQFISSGERKWGRMCGLVMLLPHGYEGQGPEHSSARLERYLQLCAEENMQVCIPSTPAQIYHILRRQILRSIRRPLIIMSPKSLLRHPLAVASFDELANGTFLPVISEIDQLDPKFVKRVVMCSGKVYYELLENRRMNNLKNIAIIRIEQLYPFPYREIKEVLESYSHVLDFVWCQEEPLNQGAWYYSQYYFRKIIPFKAILRYIGRPASASPAVGNIFIHHQQQKNLVNDALKLIN